jgi:hypothetical protein
MGNSLFSVNDLEFETCCCGGLATYRCQHVGRTWGMKGRIKELEPHLRSTSTDDRGLLLYQYVSCNSCISDKVYGYFTHHPEGWKCNIKMFIDYEPLKEKNIQKIA